MTDDFVGEALAILYAIEREDRVIAAYLVKRARAAAVDATKRMLQADPTDTEEIRHQQFEVRRLFDIVRWLREAQYAGREVLTTMDTTEREAILSEVFGSEPLNDA